MNLSEKLDKYKNEIMNSLGCTRQTIYYYKTKGIIPRNKEAFKKIFFATNGAVDPNSILGVDGWRNDLKKLKEQQKGGSNV